MVRGSVTEPGATANGGRRRAWVWTAVIAIVGLSLFMVPASWVTPSAWSTVDLDDLPAFRFDEITGTTADVPRSLRVLDGHRVTVVGYAFGPDEVGAGRVAFQIVGNGRLHDRGPPLVQQRVIATTVPRPGGTAVMSSIAAAGMLTVMDFSGTFHVRVDHDSTGRVESLFCLDVDGAVTHSGPSRSETVAIAAVRSAGGLMLTVSVVTAVRSMFDVRRRQLAWLSFRCPDCGYDLRATPGRCPECGRTPAVGRG